VRASVVSALETEIRRLVREEVRALLGSRASDEYSSADLPPSIRTAKAFARLCSTGKIPDAQQDGPRGIWRCSREAWHRARDRRPTPRLSLVPDDRSDEELVALALDARRAGARR
jgi:hypothetical protein